VDQYSLPPHVHYCLTEDGAVFLDLKRDVYLGVGIPVTRALTAVVRGWPQTSSVARSAEPTPAEDVALIVDALTRRGLLTQHNGSGQPASPAILETPQLGMCDVDTIDWTDFRGSHAATFLSACASSAIRLRLLSLTRIVNRVTRRKCARADLSSAFPIDFCRELTRSFLRLRALTYTARDACLFDSLVLVEFLAHYRLFPTWIIGVTTGPFKAHSWVQHGHVVLNDTPERVRTYTPILTI